MSERGFEILLEDDSLIGVAKPTGVATQAPPAIDSLEARIRAYLAAAIDRGPSAGSAPSVATTAGDARREIYLGIPHRLDRPASGAMVFAKTRRAARNLARQFERRRVRKLYWACVQGTVEPADGTWTDYLCKVYGQPKTMVVDAAHAGGQIAVLHYRTIGRHRHGSWLEIELETGRTHQVRIQAASRGWPLLGDEHYGGELPFGRPTDDARLRPIALHARSLELFHPLSREAIALVAPVPEDWQALEHTPAVSASEGNTSTA